MHRGITAAVFGLLLLGSEAAPTEISAAARCKCFPGDSCWPSPQEWTQFNQSIEGRLIANVPIARTCHDPSYDGAKCIQLKSTWDFPRIHFDDPASIMSPAFQNYTCDPFQLQDKPCTLGNLPVYSVNASRADHIQKAVNFATSRNLRLAIKNTGHDFLGRSNGAGALSIWTHNMQSIQFNKNYVGPTYQGPAAILGSGIPASVAYTAASKAGYRVVGGTCPTVGIAGGFTQGGGHGLLASTEGLGADQVLEWEVVTPDGNLIRANTKKNSDLYWALSGGGGGNIGVVVSLTVKVSPDAPTTGAVLSWSHSGSKSSWEPLEILAKGANVLTEAGSVLLVSAGNASVAATITAPRENDASLKSRLSYITDALASRNISYSLVIQTDPSYFAHFSRYYGPLPYGAYPTAHLIHSRVIPRKLFESQSKIAALTSISRSITTNNEWGVSLVMFNAGGRPAPTNAVPPAWRSAQMLYTIYSAWDWTSKETMVKRGSRLTNELAPALEQLTPGSVTYANEADHNQKDWQKHFFGDTYGQLQSIKKKYDPKGILYARKSPGAEDWTTDHDGRLCRVA